MTQNTEKEQKLKSHCQNNSMTKVKIETVPPFYRGYVEHVKHVDVLEALVLSCDEMMKITQSIPEEKGEFKYQTDKWSIKELLCHVIDAERIFSYRALRFARNDKSKLTGFDEQQYAPEANAHQRTLIQISGELYRLRQSTLDLFASLTPTMLERTGHANEAEISVLNLGYIIAGHETHHRLILQQRYITILR